MRTAHNHLRPRGLGTAAFGFCAGFLVLVTAVHAADLVTPPTSSPPPPLVVDSAPAAMPSAAVPPASPAPVEAALKTQLPLPSADPVADKDEKGGKGLANAEDRLTDSVKGVVKHMNATDNVTLDDLNSARQAVAKIDALIDIEKRLAELEKLRNEREGHSMSSSIPASALIPPMPMQQPVMVQPVSFQPSMIGTGTEVSRIIGSAGRYSATIKSPDGQSRTVKVGDHVNGSKVLAITAAGVELEQNGIKRLLPVKNVETVFHSP